MVSEENIRKIAESELVFKILEELVQGKKTPTELADNLNTSSQSINNYLKLLVDISLVKKLEKEGRKQPYVFKQDEFEIRKDGELKEIFWHYWNEKIAKNTDLDSYEDFRSQNIDMTGSGLKAPPRSSFENQLEGLLFVYLDRMLAYSAQRSENDSVDDFQFTIKDVFTDIFSRQARILAMESNKEDLPDWTKAIIRMVTMSEAKDLGSYEILNIALSAIED